MKQIILSLNHKMEFLETFEVILILDLFKHLNLIPHRLIMNNFHVGEILMSLKIYFMKEN